MKTKEKNNLFFDAQLTHEEKFDYTVKPDVFFDSEKVFEKYNNQYQKQQWTWIDDLGGLL